ncbi:reverse transcriptase domain, Reverse transcriptase zinc-binding domain protein [Artemisia annua]|uniref:Reverse transcriptase domain, Reverse transcriptase zinc-binding domain protein n=1 Tax=Artemisia annua TaxID=35608 RepID=A0A2U1MM77_ARTAN|nr:reverse transcriptase domain, Reverse transcriptase zinc-binding domain protein [Artemisia annua]
MDDALFFREWSKPNMLCLVHELKCLYDVSGLKINLAKCQLFGICVSLAVVESITRSINCLYRSPLFTHLVLPVGKDMRKTEDWDEVVNCFSKSLSMWKPKLMSLGGRLTLVKAILGSLPLYLFFFSIFKAPEDIFFSPPYIPYRNRLPIDSRRDITSWVCWNKVMLDKEDGDFFNDSMLADAKLSQKVMTRKEVSMAWVANWAWRRQPTERCLGDIISVLNIIDALFINAYKEDEWAWKIENSGLPYSMVTLAQHTGPSCTLNHLSEIFQMSL